MPLTANGMQAEFFGANTYQQVLDKIEQLRRDMRHIQVALQTIEGQVRRNQTAHPVKPQFVQGTAQLGDTKFPDVAANAMKPQFSILHNWCLSAMESYYAMVWAAYGGDKASEIIRDFEGKFKNFTSLRSIQQGH